MNIKHRLLQNEKLDNLSLEGKELLGALDSLAWVNQWMGNNRTIIQTVGTIIRQHKTKQSFHIIDLGCGGGDVMRKLAIYLLKKGVDFTMVGMDGNPNSLMHAQQKSKRFPQISYQRADILHQDFELPSCDILISSHFIYHFQEQQFKRFLKNNLSKIRIAFVNSGLERNPLAFTLFKTFSFLMPLSRLAKEDGLVAIRRAFTKKELVQEIETVPNLYYQVEQVPLFRLKTTIFPTP